MRGLAALCFMVPVSLAADPVAIRTGEHETFSRFVLTIGEGTGWDVSAVEGGILLSLGDHADGFETSTVFDRIPRDRVSRVSQPAIDQLLFEVECQCSADAFLWQPGRLVIDIVDGEEFLNPLDVANNPRTVSSLLAAQPSSATPQALPDLLTLRQDRYVPQPPVPALIEEDVEAPVLEDPDDLSATENALIEGLARAASQGFLDANIEEVEEPETPIAENAEVVEEAPTPQPTGPQNPGIGITTALDRELEAMRGALEQSIEPTCLPADMFALAEWGGEGDFHAQVAALAEELAGEFGAEPREAQDKLARLYLHFGFGAEARAVLAADPTQSQDRAVLMQLAGLIDEYEGDYAVIAGQAGCDTPAALWAFMIAPQILNDEGRNHILQSFFAMPHPLRGHIAPRLSRQFLDVGETEVAERVLRAVDDVEIVENHEAASTRALIAESRDEPEVALAVLAEQAADNARTTPDSLIRLIELGIETGMPVAEADLILAAAMRQEHRDTPIAVKLALAEAAGRTQLGEYEAALDLVANHDNEEAIATLNTIFAEMTKMSDAETFLGFVFADQPDGLSARVQNSIASRLIELGFPERALAFLDGPAQREDASERRYLRAAAEIGTARYASAVDALLGMTTPRANDLRARAFAGMGEFRAALEASSTETSDANLEFRAGAWERLSVDEDGPLSTFAQTVIAPPATENATTLADRRAILAQSQDSRRAVEELLLQFDGTPSQE